MSANDDLKKAMQELSDASAAVQKQHQEDLQQHRADAAALADLAGKLAAGVQGAPDVDIAATAMAIHEQALALKNSIGSSHTDAVGAQTANAGTSHVQGGNAAGPDVVSASSPGTIVPPPSGTEASNAVPDALGGGAMPRKEATDGSTAEKAPGSVLPPTAPEPEEKPAEPAVPGIEDVPSKVSDEAKGGTKG